ncbi:MAG TPA: hypothetical protein VL860_03785 [Planctomycetota bacterium]|nr:hypothetical protein [Planctomycetota bacterium]
MLFNRLLVFLGGVIIFSLGLLLVLASREPDKYAAIISEFITSCRCIKPSNAFWYGSLGVLLMFMPVFYVAKMFSAWRQRRFWQVALGPNIVSLDLKPMERAIRNRLEMEEDVESARVRLAIPEFGRNRLVAHLMLSIAEQPALARRVEELRKGLADQVQAMLPELKLETRVRIRLATRLDARLFAPSGAAGGAPVDASRL